MNKVCNASEGASAPIANNCGSADSNETAKGCGTTASAEELTELIKAEKERLGAVILAHYYTRPEVQDLADFVGDSLALARIATTFDNKVVVMCGVHFMAETVKILCPEKTVLMPDETAGCSLADSCPADEFEAFVKARPGHTVVSYVNTSAQVKALSDVLVTSSNALKVVESFPKDAKLIFGPDRNLGNYINMVTGREMTLWDGACHVHERFSLEKILELKEAHPGARVLVHPECRRQLLTVADKVGSTGALLSYAKESDADTFIVATESGILHKMRAECPGKTFLPVPPDEIGCGCNDCAYMKLVTLEKIYNCLRDMSPQVEVDDATAANARKAIERMLELS